MLIQRRPLDSMISTEGASGSGGGVTTAGAAYCWGEGTGTVSGPVKGDQPFVQVSAGNEFSCGITTDGRAYCWGNDTHGALGDGSRPTTMKNGVLEEHMSDVPVPIATDARFRAIFAGKGQYACAIARDETVYCWGKIHQRLQKTFGDYGQVRVRAAVTTSAAR